MPEIREPIKQTSIEKKNKIIDAGLKIFSEKGYYNTTTAEIAKVAGVSTGIVYQYFKDKKDILIYAVKKYYDRLFNPIASELEKITKLSDFDEQMKSVIDVSIKLHRANSVAHEEMIAMSHLDPDIHQLFIESEHRIIERIVQFLESIDIDVDHMHEKAHIAYNMVESLSHEFVYHQDDDVDYDFLVSETVRLIKAIFVN
ncbi:MAG: TetR/AcrR family transcriptional regulator [Acholeplasmatales bacterium]|nr:TetR/AcrR family transcriptional regulator [Acholeplasmatales bacterium]